MKPRMLLFIAVLVVLAVPMNTQLVLADHEATNVSYISIDGDRFYNWDFQDDQEVSASNVDWPVTMVFWNDAEIDLVKGMYYGTPIFASWMHARLMDNGTWVWDRDRGTKSIDCPVLATADHLRLYADSNDQMYNISWGYYVLGTTHQDYNECNFWGAHWSGKSESAEENLADFVQSRYSGCGVWVDHDWADFANAESYEYVSSSTGPDHIKDNNGRATAVFIPNASDWNPIACG